MTDDDLADFVPDLIRWEGSVSWLYRDVLGYVTVGIGNLVHEADAAVDLPLHVVDDGGRLASPDEIRHEFVRVVSLPKGMAAIAYRAPKGPRIELTADGVTELAIARLRDEFLPKIEKLLPGFEGFPVPARAGIVDIAWNCGVRGLERFGHMLRACDQRDWIAAAAACHRGSARVERNDWTRDKFLAAAHGE